MQIPYKCRCEALGENKRRGGLYKSLKSENHLNFTVNGSWKTGSVFLCGKNQTVVLNGNTINLSEKCDITDFLDFSGINKISANDTFLIKRPSFYVSGAKVKFRDDSIVLSLSFGPSGKPKALGAELYDENLSLTDKTLAETGEIIFRNIDNTKEYTILLVTDDECLKLSVPEKEQKGFNMAKITNANVKSVCDFDFKLFGDSAKLLEIINNSKIVPERIDYEVFNQQEVTFKGSAKLPEIKPGTSKVVKLDFDFPSLSFFEYFLKLDIGGNVKIIKLPNTQSEPESYYTTEMNDILFTETDNAFVIKGTNGDDFEITISKDGMIESCEKDGKKFIENNVSASPCDFITVLGKNDKYVTILSTFSDHSVFYAIYGDGEIGISVIGEKIIEFPVQKRFEKAYYFGKKDEVGIYDEKSDNVKTEETRFLALYGDDLDALLIKGMPIFDSEINGEKLLIKGNTYSFTLRCVNMDEEDIVREARTLPAIEQNG